MPTGNTLVERKQNYKDELRWKHYIINWKLMRYTRYLFALLVKQSEYVFPRPVCWSRALGSYSVGRRLNKTEPRHLPHWVRLFYLDTVIHFRLPVTLNSGYPWGEEINIEVSKYYRMSEQLAVKSKLWKLLHALLYSVRVLSDFRMSRS